MAVSGIELIPGASLSASGLSAERARMEISANNLANVHSTRGPNGSVYQRKVAVFSAVFNDSLDRNRITDNLGGVELEEVATSRNPNQKVFMPFHPDADGEGLVEMPNVKPIEEMVDMITATRAYEANLSVMKQSKEMAEKTITMTKQ